VKTENETTLDVLQRWEWFGKYVKWNWMISRLVWNWDSGWI